MDGGTLTTLHVWQQRKTCAAPVSLLLEPMRACVLQAREGLHRELHHALQCVLCGLPPPVCGEQAPRHVAVRMCALRDGRQQGLVEAR